MLTITKLWFIVTFLISVSWKAAMPFFATTVIILFWSKHQVRSHPWKMKYINNYSCTHLPKRNLSLDWIFSSAKVCAARKCITAAAFRATTFFLIPKVTPIMTTFVVTHRVAKVALRRNLLPRKFAHNLNIFTKALLYFLQMIQVCSCLKILIPIRF